MKILVTGGAGFIGSALVRYLINHTEHSVVNVDTLTYAANLDSLREVESSERYVFEQVDICDAESLESVFGRHAPDAVMHLAAESHVDRSIDGPAAFVQTNVMGTFVLLEAARSYWDGLAHAMQKAFRFLHVSTDEVYGSLGDKGKFTEDTPYAPNSPYSASKAGADHLVRAWHNTYGLPILISNCSNNYGPCQFPEKFIPTVVLAAIEGRAIPVYGDGSNIRDWLYVDDHVMALLTILQDGEVGRTYNIGGDACASNIDLVHTICGVLDERLPGNRAGSHAALIEYVSDRPGHDKRYAIDASRLQDELDWAPQMTLDAGIRQTVDWYLDNPEWCQAFGRDRKERLGLGIAAGGRL